jgi:ankyrin repeat protein
MNIIFCALFAFFLNGVAHAAAIHDAVRETNLKKVKELLDLSPDFAVLPDEHGKTPLHLAAEKGDTEILKTLLSTKPQQEELNAKDKKGTTALDLALSRGYARAVIALLESGATPELQNGQTLLHWAAASGISEVVQYALAQKPDINARDGNGFTALQVAAVRGQRDVVKLIIAHTKYLNAPDKGGCSLLHWATERGDVELAKDLIHAQANVNVRDKRGYSPLHIAAERGDRHIVALLLGAEARVNLRENRGLTPLTLAELNGHDAVVAIIKHHTSQKK